MSLVGRVGRRQARARLAMAVLYCVLVVGAVTTLYPFLLMVSTGFKGPTDQNDNRMVPAFWTDRTALLAKYVDDKYAGDASAIASTRIGHSADDATIDRYERFLMELPLDHWTAGFRTASNQVTGRLNLKWQDWLRARYGGDVDRLNSRYTEINTGFQTVAPPNELLDRKAWVAKTGPKWDDWQEFKATLPAEFRVPVRAERMFQEFLRSKFENQIGRVPAEVLGTAKEFEAIRLPESGPLMDEFLADRLPDRFSDRTVETRWRHVENGPLPIVAMESRHVARHGGTVAREMSGRNYRYVFDFIAIHGRALWNTAVFCLLAVVTQLVVNVLAAYALSRFPMRATAKLLLFLLATMAFPAEVALIPSFLLLKDLNLLNTFAALVLPTAASGYMIFLLKGFFDSLPGEIFESGQIDGARESTMMWKLALPLSKPVMGYMALLAFMGAYGSFMYAFLVAQDQRMWTLMVYIYQLQQTAPKAVMMAAVTIAALPTLVVFLFAQRVIMRGIVLPDER